MRHIMMDIETLSTKMNAAILSIGAVVFDPNSDRFFEEFYMNVELEGQINNRDVSADTLYWWLGQPNAARSAVLSYRVPLRTALTEFRIWYTDIEDGTLPVWAHGSTFDHTILEHAYEHNGGGVKYPVHFRNKWCDRGMLAMFPPQHIPSAGVAHNALDDAKYQARKVQSSFQKWSKLS